MKELWLAFILGQILSAGSINYQQEIGCSEINPLYGGHPSAERIYVTKIVEVGLIYAAAKRYPKHERKLLYAANGICWGLIVYDGTIGGHAGFRW